MPVADATALVEQPLPSISVIHWKKMTEFFPLPEDSIIPLPTGKPKPIPRIQHTFRPESSEARELRETRLASVRNEMQHAWSGYRTYAWTHDELMPNSKAYRDPFCGWAASLVDALDTLWIMEMYKEFDEAYEAVKQIDFTTTPFRNEIPVFETTIRYLGGLLAAYDLSGGAKGKHPVLLTKAVELAEILMGVFDTPNRMPVLYYNWKPAFVSQIKTASHSVSVAELGSMSMEFTRLAQLTGNDKYYDAIARITDAFEEWQNRVDGTAIPGIFPEHIDASGCNRTAATIAENENASTVAKAQVAAAAANKAAAEPVGYQPKKLASADPIQQPVNAEDLSADTTQTDIIGKRDVLSDASAAAAPAAPAVAAAAAPGVVNAVTPEAVGSSNAVAPPVPIAQSGFGSSAASAARMASWPLAANGRAAEYVCIPQNLTAGGYGMQAYGMGGSQDSTYEYFPKVCFSKRGQNNTIPPPPAFFLFFASFCSLGLTRI